jgi:hypothetical protein
MASLREQILDRIKVALAAAAPGGATVFRSREVSITRAQAPAIVLMPKDNNLTRLSTGLDKNQFDLELEIFTRGDPWDQLADPIDLAAHTVLMGDAPLAALCSDVRRVAETFEAQEADRTSGTLSVRYRVTYLTQAGDISRGA